MISRKHLLGIGIFLAINSVIGLAIALPVSAVSDAVFWEMLIVTETAAHLIGGLTALSGRRWNLYRVENGSAHGIDYWAGLFAVSYAASTAAMGLCYCVYYLALPPATFATLSAGVWIFGGVTLLMTTVAAPLGTVVAMPGIVHDALDRSERVEPVRDQTGKAPATGRISQAETVRLRSELERLMNEGRIFCDEDLSLARLSELLGASRHEVSELFRDAYRTNFYGYINERRIAEARRLLLEEADRSVLSIAFAVGYNSKSTFNAAFKKATGLTPREFRRAEIGAVGAGATHRPRR